MPFRRKCSTELHLHCICTTKLLFEKSVRRNCICIAFSDKLGRVIGGSTFALHLVAIGVVSKNLAGRSILAPAFPSNEVSNGGLQC